MQNAFKKSYDVENEMVRLNDNLLQPVYQILCDSTSASYLTIALLNVRSIVAKMPDIKQDNNLKSASIKCFCETWLNASQLSPIVQHDQIDIRCDRMTCDSKGGVMICAPSQMKPYNTQRFVSNGLESVCTTLTLPTRSRSRSRSPVSVPQWKLHASGTGI